MFWFVIGLVILLGSIVASCILSAMMKRTLSNESYVDTITGKNRVNKTKQLKFVILIVGIVISVLLFILSFIVTVAPGEYGIAYQPGGSTSEMNAGYNFVAPWARIYLWNTKMQVVTFSQGEAIDDIYGAQTTEKDFIEVVATMGVHIDTSNIEEYIKLYGNEQISSNSIMKLLKTLSRNSIEKAIGSYTTAEVMGNKKKIGEEAETYLRESIQELPIVLDSFTIDDLVAPDSYENAIKEQAQLRMDKEKATLQQQINEQQAIANKTKAEGEAAVAKTQAEADATVKQIEAENAAAVAKIQADNEAEVKKIQANAEAEVRKTQADAKATETTTQANAEAEAIIKKGEAEASAIKAQGEAYRLNEQLIDLRKTEINAEVQKQWAENWSGFSFEGMSGFNFANLTDILKGIIPSINSSIE